MTFAKLVLAALERLLPVHEASAHCDIPCGIYDPHAAQLGALTVIRMFQLIDALEQPGPNATKEERAAYVSSVSRYVAIKEEHAGLCKKEVLILWTDYFKPEHLENHPELHQLVWETTKLCSTVKQEMNAKAAQELLAGVQKIAEIFWATKGMSTRRQPSLQPPGGELVYPEPKQETRQAAA